jgi:hypothetical protein
LNKQKQLEGGSEGDQEEYSQQVFTSMGREGRDDSTF